jgi:hypothetical protein
MVPTAPAVLVVPAVIRALPVTAAVAPTVTRTIPMEDSAAMVASPAPWASAAEEEPAVPLVLMGSMAG